MYIELPLLTVVTVLILAVVVAYLAFNSIFVHMQIKELWHEISNLPCGRGLTTSKTSSGASFGRSRTSKDSESLKASSEGHH